MLISGGENVYPSEIERVITLPQVAECAVFGILIRNSENCPPPISHQVWTALTEAGDGALRAASARFRGRLIKFVTDFPKTPIGKIQRTLKEPYWTERAKKI